MTEEDATPAGPIGDPGTHRREPEEAGLLSARKREVDAELALFFAHSLDLLCIAGTDGYFKRLNSAWTTCLGWTLEELLAKPFLDFVHPDDRAATQVEVARVSEGAEVILFANRYRHRDGSYRWLRWNARTGPERERIYAVARDVTEEVRLKREILEIADQEKERLGRELHDGLCQTLAGIAALGTTLSKSLAMSSEASASATAAEIAKLLKEAIHEAHELAHGLGAVGLNEVGLEGALAALALSTQHRHRVSCSFACDRPFVRLRREAEVHLFRIAQEAVGNALAHSKGGRIELSLASKAGQGVLSVRDDGVGVSDGTRDRNGAGMHTMAYRAHLIGGNLDVRRRTSRGTAVTCVFPLPVTSGSRETCKNK